MSLRRSSRTSDRKAFAIVVATTVGLLGLQGLTGGATGSAAVVSPQSLAAPAAPTAKQDGGTAREHVGNYDSRTSSKDVLTRKSSRLLRTRPGDLTKLATQVGGDALVAVDPLTGTPDNVSRTDGFLTGTSSRTASSIALGYVRANVTALGLSTADLESLSAPEVVTDIHGIRHVSWRQSVGGIPVFGNGLRAHVTKDGRLIALQGAPIADLAAKASAAPAPGLSAEVARATAAADVDGVTQPVAKTNLGGAAAAARWANGDQASLVYFVTANGVRAGWQTYVQTGSTAAYQSVVDAVTGKTLYRRSTVNEDRGDGLVYDNYPGAANGGKQRIVNIFDRGYIDPRRTWLNGEYARVWADVDDDDRHVASERAKIPGTRTSAGFKLVKFNGVSSLCSPQYICTWNPNRAFSWKANLQQDGTQAFILTSRFHDYLANAPIGFTDAMGNFEAGDGDPVRVNVLDGADTDEGFPDGDHIDNANMNTPPDGNAPLMQMYLNHVPGSTANEDPYLPASASDAADNIYHEYTHGLSNRLVVDADGNSTLNSLHAGSMGEAWSDYYALDYLVGGGYLKDTGRGGEVIFDRYLTKNRTITRSEAIDCHVGATSNNCRKAVGPRGGYTFGDLGNATGGPQVHADGEIWSQTLWDLRGEIGRRATNAVVTEAMSLSPADPSFLDMRDSILLSDRAIYGGTNEDAIWSVFAERGMGWFASATDGADASVVEDFQTKPRPGTPRRVITGSVTDAGTRAPIQGALVRIPGHSSALGDYSATTDADGEYRISRVLAGRYPEITAQAPGYDVASQVADTRARDIEVDFELRRDWAAASGGASIEDFNGPDYTDFGCGPANAIDLDYGLGWGSTVTDGSPATDATPKYIVVELPEPVNISAFGVDPSNTCGDAGSASLGDYRIDVSQDGETFTEVNSGTFTPSDRGRVNEIPLDDPADGVTHVRIWMDSTQVAQIKAPDEVCEDGAPYDGCLYMDMTELEVYGDGSVMRDIQLLSFNDFHGHLEATDEPQSPLPAGPECDTPPGATGPTCVGGAEYLASYIERARADQPLSTLTVAAGDLIGGSTFMSGLFQDQPSVEAMNELGLDVSSVGNHEFDEGLTELRRMIKGGCQPAPDGCFQDAQGDDIPYGGAEFKYLGANVVDMGTGKSLPWLPGTAVRSVDGVKIGFIGMTLEATDTLVNPAGVAAVDFEDEVETANAKVPQLKNRGVEAIVVLLHEGGYQAAPVAVSGCNGISGPILTIAQGLDPEIDQVVSGHTHQPYVCSIDDPDGDPRLVTSAASFGQVLTESHLKVNRLTGEVDREASSAVNNLVLRGNPDITKDAGQTAIIDFWKPLATALGNQVVGTVNADITGDANNTCRCEETPMADTVADAILFGTEAEANGGADLALMNTGGVRASLLVDTISGGEQPGEITYAEAYNVAPFNNILVTVDLTGAEIEAVLNQQFQRVPARGSRPMLSLGVSEGFTYTWEWEGATPAPNTQPGPATTGGHVVPGSMELNGTPLVATQTYRVATLNFLADGGDLFTAFAAGENRVGGPEDLPNFVAYLEANAEAGLDPPADRVTGL